VEQAESSAPEGPIAAAGSVAIPELARNLRNSGDLVASVEAFEQAIALEPHRADLLVELGMVWQERNDPDAALASFRRALAQDPDNVAALQNIGCLLCNLGEPDEALEHYARALHIWPSPISQMLAATVLPVVYRSRSELQAWRERIAGRVRALADSGLRVDTARSQVPTSFLLAYQGENDREIAANLGRIYQGLDAREIPGAVSVRPRMDERLRVGFLSAYFCDHTIGRLNLGTIEQLSRSRFEVTVLAAGSQLDEWSAAFEQAADRFLQIPRNVERARREIAAQDLDVLVFTDVGMDSITSTLAYSRMAPIQCVTWGHPDTTGSPAVDYFVSGSLLEIDDADKHYTERLVRLPGIGNYYYRPAVPDLLSRESLGLSPEWHSYVCPQTLFKFHPDFDEVLAGILATDPAAEVVVLAGRVRSWAEQLRRRWNNVMPDHAHRIRFLPAQPYEPFLRLLAVADVVLDPLHFGGGNSSYEALAMGAPVVTLPSSYLRGRITGALYAKMGLPDLVVSSPAHYIETAVRLGTDRSYNELVRRRIRAASSVLFEDLDEVRGWEQFLESAVAARQTNGSSAPVV
jgi:predicted O-linked N-acetylglucosamine transferase (SPINDLY family)